MSADRPTTAALDHPEPPVLPRPSTPDEALTRLIEGNRRFAEGRPLHPNRSVELRKHLADGQAPYVAVLACADSRVTPELVFDCGIGELFVCRVAGNVATDAATASLLFAVDKLGTDVLLVLGHTACGAVTEAVHLVVEGGDAGEYAALIEPIAPAVADARAASSDGGDVADDLVEPAIEANVRRMAEALTTQSPGLAAAAAAGRVRIVSGVLDLRSGLVRLLD